MPTDFSHDKNTATLAWLSVVRVYNLCDAAMATRLAPLGLRVGEHEVLANLLRAPGITQQELAKRCFVAKSGISMMLTRACCAARPTPKTGASSACTCQIPASHWPNSP